MNIKKTYLSANKYLADTWQLAAQIRKSDWKPDLLVGLWRGGSPVAIAVHEFLKASGWNVEHMPLKCGSYSGIGANAGEVIINHGEIVLERLREGTKVLLIDDVFDTGKTAVAMRKHLRQKPGVDMRFACVYWKPGKNTTDMRPDYFTHDIGNDWIVFPHEIEGLTKEEIMEKDPQLAALL